MGGSGTAVGAGSVTLRSVFKRFRKAQPRPVSLGTVAWCEQALPEFLDDTDRVAPWRPSVPPPRDAWRNGRYRAETFELRTTTVARLVNPRRLDMIVKDEERLSQIGGQMADRGLDEVLVLVVDLAGRVGLQDGHHRFLCAYRLGWERLPCRLKVSDRLRSHGLPVHEVLAEMLVVGSYRG